MAEQTAIYDHAYAALQAGKTPTDEAVMDIAERHRLSIDRWFYPCSHGCIAGSPQCTKAMTDSGKPSTRTEKV